MEGIMERKELNKLIGKNIRWLRKNTSIFVKGKKTILNQTYLGKFLGIIPQQISKFEIGKNELGAVQVYQYSKFFNIPIDTLYEKDLVNQKYNKEVVIKDEYLYQLTGTLTKNWPYAQFYIYFGIIYCAIIYYKTNQLNKGKIKWKNID